MPLASYLGTHSLEALSTDQSEASHIQGKIFTTFSMNVATALYTGHSSRWAATCPQNN